MPLQTTGLEVGTYWEEVVGHDRNNHLQVKVSVDGQQHIQQTSSETVEMQYHN
jgi:hypothetical protein